MEKILHRYWIVVYPEAKYQSGNIGVTAYSLEDARTLAKEQLKKFDLLRISAEEIDTAEIVEDIDIRLLDPGRIIPNMGIVSLRGVWFPRLNI